MPRYFVLILIVFGQMIPTASAASKTLYDTLKPGTYPKNTPTFKKDSWLKLGEENIGQTFQGDGAFIAKNIAVIFHQDGTSIDLYAKGINGWTQRARIAPIANGVVQTFSEFTVIETKYTKIIDAHILNAAEDKIRFELRPYQYQLKATQYGKAQALRISVPSPIALFPAFFTEDLVINPKTLPQNTIKVPDLSILPKDSPQNDFHNLLLHLTGANDSLVISTWEACKKDIEFSLTGKGKQRLITSTDIHFKDGGSIWTAIIELKNSWHASLFNANKLKPKMGRDQANTSPPFPANWREVLTLSNGASFERDFISEPKGNKDKSIKAKSSAPPNWIEIIKQEVSTRKPNINPITDKHSLIIRYPFDRVSHTPLTHLSVVDVFRSTLHPRKYLFVGEMNLTNVIQYDKTLAKHKGDSAYPVRVDECIRAHIASLQLRISSYINLRNEFLILLDATKDLKLKQSTSITHLTSQLTKFALVNTKHIDPLQPVTYVSQAKLLLAQRAKARKAKSKADETLAFQSLEKIYAQQIARLKYEKLQLTRLRLLATAISIRNHKLKAFIQKVQSKAYGLLSNGIDLSSWR